MKKILIILIPLILLTVVFLFIVLFLNKDSGKGALQVTSVPKSQVLLDGKYIGNTPLCLCQLPEMIPVGSYTIKLIPQSPDLAPFEEKIKINSSVLTVVDQTFGDSTSSSGSTISLNKISDKNKVELMVISFPSSADIAVDNNITFKTPHLFSDITASDHEVKLIKDGYKEKTLKIRTVAGYRLETIVFMGVNPDLRNTGTPSSSGGATLDPIKIEKVTILSTPTGFLRVRDSDSLNSAEIGRVNPGQSFDFVSEKGDWYQIKLSDGRLGWISKTYSRKE